MDVALVQTVLSILGMASIENRRTLLILVVTVNLRFNHGLSPPLCECLRRLQFSESGNSVVCSGPNAVCDFEGKQCKLESCINTVLNVLM